MAATGHAALWEVLRTGLMAQRSAPPIEPADRSNALPASYAQEGLWLSEQLAGHSAQLNLCVALHIEGWLDTAALARSLSALLERHEVLRTRLEWSGGELQQIIVPAEAVRLIAEDLPGGRSALERMAGSEARRGFDITRPPLLRARLFRLGDEANGLVLTFHHMAFDGWSFEVFMGELGLLYGAFRNGKASPLGPPTLQYVDYAVWQRRFLQGDRLLRLREFWSTQLAGLSAPLPFPAERPRSPRSVHRGGCVPFKVTGPLGLALRSLATTAEVTPFVLFLAAYQTLLSRHCGETDVAVGSPVAQRNHAGLQRLIGPMVNILVLRSQAQMALSFRRFLADVQRTVLEAYAHQDLPFERQATSLSSRRSTDAGPLVQAMFTFLNLPQSGWSLPGLAVDAWNVHNGTARYDLSVSVWDTDGGLGGQFEYNADRFDARYVESLAQQWETLLRGVVTDPDMPLGKLPLLNDAGMRELLTLAAGPTPDYPRDQPIHVLFEAIARARPAATAVVWGASQLSYADLNARANRLAGLLRTRSVGAGSLVGLCLPASPDYVTAVLAVLKTGAAYVPIASGDPPPRLVSALRGARLASVLTYEGLRPCLAGLEAPTLVLDTPGADLAGFPADDLGTAPNATDPAYVMFTSGSTGVPKAVCIPHRGVVRLACAADYAQLGPGEVMLMLAPLAFDASTFELWGALLNGATLVIPPSVRPSLGDMAALIRTHGVTTLWLTTGLFELMVEAEPAALAQPRQVLVGGDVLSPAKARRYLDLPGAGRLINCYGPTENTTFTTCHCVREEDTAGPIPVGRPIAHTAVYLLDDNLMLVPPGVTGEAWVAGDGLMLGYLNDPVANGASLVPNPFAGAAGALMYRTGDRMRLRSDGSLQFVGRVDRQAKIRGYRVEPGEIEAVLFDHPRVGQACVLIEGDDKSKRLMAYVVEKPGVAPVSDLAADLGTWLRSRLPEPLRPAASVVLPELPLDANGKIDRTRLPSPPAHATNSELPHDPLERQVAEAFAAVLRRDNVGRHEDFFLAGGDSLMALELLVQLESSMPIQLPLIDLFRHPTPARLAAEIRSQRSGAVVPVAGVAEIRRGGTLPPLFMVPGGHGGKLELILYARLMQHLDRDMAVYGFMAEPSLPRSVEALAAIYLARLRQMQPRGPYALAGECVGGVIAYEMARQLLADGEAVMLLLLLDTWCPCTQREIRYRWGQVPVRLRFLLRLLRQPAWRWRREWQDLTGAGQRAVGVPSVTPVSPPSVEPSCHGAGPAADLTRAATAWWRRRTLGRRYIGLAMRYRPKPCDLPLHLLLSETNHRLGLASEWAPLAKAGLRVWVAPGTHESYLHDTPEQASQVLNACLSTVFGSPE